MDLEILRHVGYWPLIPSPRSPSDFLPGWSFDTLALSLTDVSGAMMHVLELTHILRILKRTKEILELKELLDCSRSDRKEFSYVPNHQLYYI